ncbi:MAG TPA: YafY family protein [Flavitalea sp.]|nr:YafY family protein [Flavitalea sp.]
MEDSPKRFDRIIAILIQLQSKRIVRAQDLADRFGVSLRTIYRDVRTLEASGVPISSEAGIGYSIQEGYKLPPVMFTKEEAMSFIAAEKLMPHFTDKSLGSYFQSSMYKIKSILRWSEKDMFDSLDRNLVVQQNHSLFRESIPNAQELLIAGIVQKKQVDISYQGFESEAVTRRTIEPIGMYHEHQFWYIVAYCLLRKDYRKFRSDRIFSIRLLDQPFAGSHQPLDYYLQEEDRLDKTKVVIRVNKKTAKYIQRSRQFYGFVSEEDRGEVIEMMFMVGLNEDFFSRWYLMFGDQAEIVEPESLKAEVAGLLKKIARKL